MSDSNQPSLPDDDDIDPRRIRSRNRLLDAAATLLSTGGVEAVTIDAVTKASKVARTTLYRHFQSSSHLLALSQADRGAVDAFAAAALKAGGSEPRPGLGDRRLVGHRHSRAAQAQPAHPLEQAAQDLALEHVRCDRTCSGFLGAYRPSACLRQSVSAQRENTLVSWLRNSVYILPD